MGFKKCCCFVSIFLIWQIQIHAKEISMLDQDPDKTVEESNSIKTVESVVPEKKPEDPMRAFINQENERLREIKLLDLDVMRADLQLKQKEIQSKLSKYEQSSEVNIKDVASDPIKLNGIVQLGAEKQAIVLINGSVTYFKIGQFIDSAYKVKSISDDRMVITDEQGQEKIIMIGR